MNVLEHNFRHRLVYEVVDEYVSHYTCAAMADDYGTVVGEQKDANEWLELKVKEYAISKYELNEALNRVVKERKEDGNACLFSARMFDEGDENE